MVTQPITNPAQAQAMATERALRAPSSNAWMAVIQLIPSRVSLRISATGRQASAATSAHRGAEKPMNRPTRMIRIGMNRCPRCSITWPKRGSSDSGMPASL